MSQSVVPTADVFQFLIKKRTKKNNSADIDQDVFRSKLIPGTSYLQAACATSILYSYLFHNNMSSVNGK